MSVGTETYALACFAHLVGVVGKQTRAPGLLVINFNSLSVLFPISLIYTLPFTIGTNEVNLQDINIQNP